MSQAVRNDTGDPWGVPAAPWIWWSEIQASDWKAHEELRGWDLMFTLMENLADAFGGERVRLVVWFPWDAHVDG
jgi:hypothetical protein